MYTLIEFRNSITISTSALVTSVLAGSTATITSHDQSIVTKSIISIAAISTTTTSTGTITTLVVSPTLSSTQSDNSSQSDNNGSSSVGVILVLVIVVIITITVVVVGIIVIWKRKKSEEHTKPESAYYSTIDETTFPRSPINKPEPIYSEMNDEQNNKEPQYMDIPENVLSTKQADKIIIQDNPAYSTPN